MSWEISFQNLVLQFPRYKSNCFHESFLPERLQRNGGSKFISMALAKINPQNELEDIISDPHEKLNSFRRIIQIV